MKHPWQFTETCCLQSMVCSSASILANIQQNIPSKKVAIVASLASSFIFSAFWLLQMRKNNKGIQSENPQTRVEFSRKFNSDQIAALLTSLISMNMLSSIVFSPVKDFPIPPPQSEVKNFSQLVIPVKLR